MSDERLRREKRVQPALSVSGGLGRQMEQET
jgi:hypothetical protein